jgi:hypothetical protein
MNFLDNLILGSSTPRYADKVCYPSATFKMVRCMRKHCTPVCDQRIFGEFEFWAYALSERPLSKAELRKNIHSLSRDLRFSVWVRHSGCRDLSAEMKVASFVPDDTERGAGHERRELGAGVDSKIERDADIVRLILRLCKSSQQEVFEVTVNVVEQLPGIRDHELLVLFVRFILELPYSNARQAFKLALVLVREHNFYEAFSSDTTPRAFWRHLLASSTPILERLIDLLMCYEHSDLSAIPSFLMDETGSEDVDRWVAFLSCPSNIVKVGAVLEQNTCVLGSSTGSEGNEETYFDFLIVQNELIKAQEEIKRALGERILSLERERDELILQNDNLASASNVMEEELRECQEGYASEIKRMLYESKGLCERYEQENLELKRKLYGCRRRTGERPEEQNGVVD